MYINRIRRIRYKISGIIQTVNGVLFVIIAMLGFYDMVFRFEEVESFWGLFPFFAIGGALLLFVGIRNLITVSACTLFNEAFKKDSDGVVTVAEISLRTGISEKSVLKRLQLLIKKRCLINILINFTKSEGVSQPVVILENSDESLFRQVPSEAEYVVIYCPNCGSSGSVKKGAITKCRFCGGYIKGN